MIRTFTMQDQLSFARLSGDYNPMHVDAITARRLLYGRPVVHGIHVLLWAIDALLLQMEQSGSISAPIGIASLTTSFRAPIMVDDPVELTIAGGNHGRWKLEVFSQGTRLANTVLVLRSDAAESSPDAVSPELPKHTSCRELCAADLAGATGQLPLCLQPQLAADLFPGATRFLANEQLATLLAATRLVGMETPGLHSLFIGLELTSCKEVTGPALTYAAEEFDPRFSMLSLEVKGAGLSGRLSAALRPLPAAQAGFAAVRRLVNADEFTGQRALVIGGSRGLGEVVVEQLVAGGADVRFTYHRGIDDARRIVDEVAAAGGLTSCFAYDAASDAPNLARLLAGWTPTAFYYFATPFIFSCVAGRFSTAMFRKFCDCYVEQFLAAFDAIRAFSPELTFVFYPSSSAITELPSNMAEYATAKAAGETLCAFLRKSNPRVRLVTSRLPRLATDQTASLIRIESADPVSHMLDLLRKISQTGEEFQP